LEARLAVLAAFAVVSTLSIPNQGGLTSGDERKKVFSISLSQHDEKHVVPTAFNAIMVGLRRRETNNYK
jgi:hypothetical protein